MKKVLILIVFFSVLYSPSFAQVELVPVEHRVYDFLRRMDTKGVIDFNSAAIPVSRRDVAEQLRVMSGEWRVKSDELRVKSKLSKNDRMMLNDFLKEFEFEVKDKGNHEFIKFDKLNELKTNLSLNRKDFFNDNEYIIKYIDSNVAVWGHLTTGLYQRNGWGDSLGGKKFLGGDLGFDVRGTMYDRVGFAMSYSNGTVFAGDSFDKLFANVYDPYFRTAVSLKDDGKFFEHFRGYLRYEVPKKWLSLMVGKVSLRQGFGFVDNLFYSGILPYSMIKLDMKYKAIAYTFSYGNITGDSAGITNIPNKMISTHRLDVRFAKWIRAGFYESVVTSNSAFNFVHFNPLAFITSADLNTGGIETYKSNSLLGFDVEVKPFKNVAVQASLLVDDFNYATITNDDNTSNDNKFGYQAGVLWNDAFTVSGLSGAFEYTRLDPFVYAHRDNKQQYTHWGYSLGHQLPPNSDEVALKFGYNVMPRLSVSATVQFQRSGEGFTYDSLGNIETNYGGNINFGVKDMYGNKNTFLQGNRVNRSILGVGFRWEPVRQWVMDMGYKYKFEDLLYVGKKGKDHFFYLNLLFKI